MIEKIEYDTKKYNFVKVFQEYFEEDFNLNVNFQKWQEEQKSLK